MLYLWYDKKLNFWRDKMRKVEKELLELEGQAVVVKTAYMKIKGVLTQTAWNSTYKLWKVGDWEKGFEAEFLFNNVSSVINDVIYLRS
jgi:hypothetical protein